MLLCPWPLPESILTESTNEVSRERPPMLTVDAKM